MRERDCAATVMEAGTSSGAAHDGDAAMHGSSAAEELADAQRLFDDGCEFMHNEAFDDAAEYFSKALEIRYAVFSSLLFPALLLPCFGTRWMSFCGVFPSSWSLLVQISRVNLRIFYIAV